MKLFKLQILLIISISFPAGLKAQRFKPSFQPHDAIGVIGGYHFKSVHNIIELGVSRQQTVHGQSVSYAISSELTKTPNNNNLYGIGLNTWFNNLWLYWISGGLSSTYYSDFGSLRALSIRPMLGIGVVGFQVVYQYDLMLINPNFDFGGNNRIAIRINLGLFELED